MDVVWSDLAMRDLNDIAHYVSEHFGDSVSLKSIDKLVRKVDRLKKFPESGVLDKAYSSTAYTIHHITLNPNVIYYLLEDDVIVVMTIVHAKRSPRYINKRLKNFLEHYDE